MALSVVIAYLYTDSTSTIQGNMGWSGASGDGLKRHLQYGTTPALGFDWFFGTDFRVNGGFSTTVTGLAADTAYYARFWGHDLSFGDAYSAMTLVKTFANPAVMGTPSSSAITSSTATITISYTPNVVSSTYIVTLYYKKVSDTSWTAAGSTTSANPFSVALTGLSFSTQYQFYADIVRTTTNAKTATSVISSFTTLAGSPTVSTGATTNVTNTTAVLNDTVAINAGTSVTTYWKWGTDNPPTQNTTSSQSVTGDGSFQVSISGLTQSTTYYAQAYVAYTLPSGSPASGAVVSFSTPVDPSAVAANEDHMHIYEYDGKYGTQSTFYFTLASPAGTSSDRLVTTAPGSLFAAGDIKLSKDGGSFANVSNSVVQVAASNPLYSLTLTAAEMQGTQNVVQIVDQNGPAFRDAFLFVRTKQQLGQLDIDASQISSSTPAMTLTAGSSAFGLQGTTNMNGTIRAGTAQAGGASTITLDGSASATNDYYKGAMVVTTGGTGPYQARLILTSDGTSKVATVHRAWAINPDATTTFIILPVEDVWSQTVSAELSGIPTYASSWADKFAFLVQRFLYKRTETATTFTMYKADSATSLGTAAVSDTGATQTHGKIA